MIGQNLFRWRRPSPSPLPLNDQRPTPAEVRHVFLELLGREPENEAIGTDRPALDFILDAAICAERMERLREQWRRDEIANSPYWVSSTDVGHFVTSTKDHVIGASLRQRRQFQEGDVAKAVEVIERLGRTVELGTFLDVGANIGTHSIFALNYGFKAAVCIEPDEENFRLLRVNQILSGVDQFCTNVQAAASDRNAKGVLSISADNLGDHRVVAGGGDGTTQRATKEISLRTLDVLLADLSVPLNSLGLCWIDTQGHEGQVLSGARSLIAAKTPLVVEFWPYGLKQAGGYPTFREIAASAAFKIVDLTRSIEEGSPHLVSYDHLDLMFDTYLAATPAGETDHSDLILVPS